MCSHDAVGASTIQNVENIEWWPGTRYTTEKWHSIHQRNALSFCRWPAVPKRKAWIDKERERQKDREVRKERDGHRAVIE